LDYHEVGTFPVFILCFLETGDSSTGKTQNFAPKCYSCKTPIVEERFISLDDPALGKRTYHEQHFFCAECGDPFLTPTSSSLSSRTGEPIHLPTFCK